jgi:hypothetical protein
VAFFSHFDRKKREECGIDSKFAVLRWGECVYGTDGDGMTWVTGQIFLKGRTKKEG